MSGDPQETQQVDEFARRVQIADATVEKKPEYLALKNANSDTDLSLDAMNKMKDDAFISILKDFIAEKGAHICSFFLEAQKKLDAAKDPTQISDAISDIWMDVMIKATSAPVRASVNIMESVIRNNQFEGQLSPEALRDIAAAAKSQGLKIKKVDNNGKPHDGIKEDRILLYAQSDHKFKTPLATHQVELGKNPRNR